MADSKSSIAYIQTDVLISLIIKVSRDRPFERCGECGNVIKLNYVGPKEDPHARMFSLSRHDLSLLWSSFWRPRQFFLLVFSLPDSILVDDHGHGHHHPPHEEPKTFVDYVKPEYWYR